MSAKFSRVPAVIAAAVLCLALVTRFVLPSRLVLGYTGATWSLLLVLAVTAISLLLLAVKAARRTVPVTRLVLPLLVLIELLRILQGQTSRIAMLIVLAALEIVAIAGAVLYVKFAAPAADSQLQPEQRIAKVMALFLPETAAGIAAGEMVVLWLAIKWIAAGFRLPKAGGFDYLEGSMAQLLLPTVVPMLCVLETLAFELWAYGRWPRLEWILGALEVWGILWCFGAYVAFKTRPHCISPDRVLLRRGLFGECSFRPDMLEGIENGPEELAARPGGVGRLDMRGVPTLLLKFREPVQLTSYFLGSKRCHSVLVSASEVAQFRAALLAGLNRQSGAGEGA